MRLILILMCLISFSASASESLLKLDTRPDVKLPVFYIKRSDATATIILLSGGHGGMGEIIDGKPSSGNFLVRSRDLFANTGLNVAVLGRPSDKKEGYVEYADRLTPEHMQDIKNTVEFLKKDTGLPVWLVGTSRGTVSATAAAIDFGNDNLGGIVLTSSVVNYKYKGAVPTQDLEKIRIPVLVLHNEKDECKACPPGNVPDIIKGLKNSTIKKLIMVSGEEHPRGDPCEAWHYHGYVDIEKPTVETIANWIKHPLP